MKDLRFRPDGSFTIAQFTDAHFAVLGEADRRTQNLMRKVLDREKPDFVALTGDIVVGDSAPDPAAALRAALEPLEERSLPWAMVFGNHDDEGKLSRRQLLEVQKSRPGCLSQSGPEELPGVGNFELDVRPSGGGPGARLSFLDSGSYAPAAPGEKKRDYAWISAEQGAWFRSRVREAPVPRLVFFHIPFPEFKDIWGSPSCRGSKFEEVCCPKVNSGFFRTLAGAGRVLGVFVGHDHVNDYEGELEGIRLVYGRATGYNGYGREGFPRGARLIRLREGQPSFETWLSLDDPN